jgi:hypothetical protein
MDLGLEVGSFLKVRGLASVGEENVAMGRFRGMLGWPQTGRGHDLGWARRRWSAAGGWRWREVQPTKGEYRW